MGRYMDSGSDLQQLIIPLFGKNTAAAGQVAMLPIMILMTLVYIMVDVLGITRQCLILQVIHYHP